MLTIRDGIVKDARIKSDICRLLDRGAIEEVHAIVLHQTDSSTAKGTIAEYKNAKLTVHKGAHFLLDKDGTLYQSLEVTRRCNQVAPIKSRCLAEHRCSPADLKAYAGITKQAHSGWNGTHNRLVGLYEAKKAYPDRYPWNPDSIGIEVVGLSLKDKDDAVIGYEKPTPQQDSVCSWFIPGLIQALGLSQTDVYRHPQLSAKSAGEAADIKW